VYPKLSSGNKRIPYADAVEEALCFGWIDSTAKRLDEHHSAQRFTPRRDATNWSQHNIERMRRLVANKLMTPAGLAVYKHSASLTKPEKLVIAPDILSALKAHPGTWKHFRAFPASYQRIRIAGIEHYRSHGASVFKRKLDYFIKATTAGKRIGFGHSE
jgi:uncharacterized protein YdeI (YjbR/CyaY-like superfamily)